MANKFEVGDRVRVYWDGCTSWSGVVDRVLDNGTLSIPRQTASEPVLHLVSPKQCRRLVKKKKPATENVVRCPDGFEVKYMFQGLDQNLLPIAVPVETVREAMEFNGRWSVTAIVPVTVWVKTGRCRPEAWKHVRQKKPGPRQFLLEER